MPKTAARVQTTFCEMTKVFKSDHNLFSLLGATRAYKRKLPWQKRAGKGGVS
jgi:hypothetical protein